MVMGRQRHNVCIFEPYEKTLNWTYPQSKTPAGYRPFRGRGRNSLEDGIFKEEQKQVVECRLKKEVRERAVGDSAVQMEVKTKVAFTPVAGCTCRHERGALQ